MTITEKSDQITRLTEQNLGAITGGDSFCYVTLIAREDAAGPMVIVVQQGKCPLYDVDLRIDDLKLSDK